MTLTSNVVPPREHNEDWIRRAKSWLERSERCVRERQKAANPQEETGLYCEQFIFLWIAFNAAYGQDQSKESESDKFKPFLDDIVKLDKGKTIYDALWNECYGSVCDLIENKWVFCDFWKFVRGLGHDEWRKEFEKQNSKYYNCKYLRIPDVADISGGLGVVFDRLYQLRNQILHGGTAFAGTWGRPQMKQGCEIMSGLVPAIIAIMKSDIDRYPDSKRWGNVVYPRGLEQKDWT